MANVGAVSSRPRVRVELALGLLVFAYYLVVSSLGGPGRVNGVQPKDYLEANSPARVWATLADGERIVIDGPRVISDTVFGWAEGEEVSIPASDLQEIRVRRISVLRSAILPAMGLAAGILGVVLVTSTEATHDTDTDSTVDYVRQLQ